MKLKKVFSLGQFRRYKSDHTVVRKLIFYVNVPSHKSFPFSNIGFDFDLAIANRTSNLHNCRRIQ